MSNNWYEASGWYEPLAQSPKNADIEEKPKKSKSKGLTPKRLIGLIAIIAVLVVSSSIAFGDNRSEPESNMDFEIPQQMPDDFKDFFSSFYSSVSYETVEVEIPEYTGKIDFRLGLSGRQGEAYELSELYKHCADSIVCIKGFVEDDQVGYVWGSGVILSEDGIILTNTHVVEGLKKVLVILNDDREFEARLIGADSISDLAVLKIEASQLPAAEFGDSNELSIGEKVAAIGNPLSSDFRSTLTDGIISGIERDMSYNGHTMNLLQTNTAINNGNSGGALFNMYGQVIGITNMKMISKYNSSIEGIGFAIPSTMVETVVNSLIENGVVRGRTSIGITVGAIPEDIAAHYNIPEGIYVNEVNKNSDAYRQGICPGDVILKANGVEVKLTSDIAELKEKLRVGDTMDFVIWRNGEILEFSVKLMDTNDIY